MTQQRYWKPVNTLVGLQVDAAALPGLAREWRERHGYLLRLLASSSAAGDPAAMRGLADRLDFNRFYARA